jgi:hypothetical protein
MSINDNYLGQNPLKLECALTELDVLKKYCNRCCDSGRQLDIIFVSEILSDVLIKLKTLNN